MSKGHILSMGELLIDFTPVGLSAAGNPVFERNPGGGPANMACAAAKLSAPVRFAGKVGEDAFGRALRDQLEQERVNTAALILSPDLPTTLAFVHLDEQGERSFSFYRHGSADTMLKREELPVELFTDCTYYFCSSVMMAEGDSRQTSFCLLEEAKAKQIPVVFDPNLRANLWADIEDMRQTVLAALPFADILKVSEEEAVFLTGKTERLEAAKQLCEIASPELLLLTMGAEGCLAWRGEEMVAQPALAVQAIDTTAAGDAFTGGLLCRLMEYGCSPAELTKPQFSELLRFATAVGGLTTTKKGAISALPTRAEVLNALKKDSWRS